MPLIQRKGAQSSQGFGEFAQSTAATYIENVFSTYLYTGTGANQTITNNIDLSTKGGLIWTKCRSAAANNALVDTSTWVSNKLLISNSSSGLTTASNTVVSSFNTNGYSLGPDTQYTNANAQTFVSWTFRKQAKFFDIVTYTGTGANRTIAHNLGSTPGCIIVKRTDTTGDWYVYHSGLTSASYYCLLDTTAAQASDTTVWNATAPTSSVFSVGTNTGVNASAGTYVAYIFASNAGGFGSSGTQNVITCGSYTGTGATGNAITLGYEPQWLLVKQSSAAGASWWMVDNMRGMTADGADQRLLADSTAAEAASTAVAPTATGFVLNTTSGAFNASGSTYIYIAIRRGPMKTPTVGTSVFSPNIITTSTNTTISTNFPISWQFLRYRDNAVPNAPVMDRLRGISTKSPDANTYPVLFTNLADAEISVFDSLYWNNTGFQVPANGQSATPTVYWSFQRAPGFFDEVCYTGTGANTTQTHNLGVVPELMIVKERDAINNWQVYSATLANTQYLVLNTAAAAATGTTRWNSTTPTSSVFSVGTDATVNTLAGTYAAYLFASCPGVSKVGSYTGTGATQTIDCGFTGGARFVLIKRTNSTGDWYVWDTARGMVSGTDPSLLLNSTAAEVNANSVYTTSVGFQIVSTAAGINASGGTYIYLAIA